MKTHFPKSDLEMNIPRALPFSLLNGKGSSSLLARSLTMFSPIPRRTETSSTV